MTHVLDKREIDKQGLCHQVENAGYWPLFFADTAYERRPVRNLCDRCPVKLECLQWALEHKEIWGFWGGCDEAELRRALWVDSNGSPTERCRYPQCPACHARPNRLFVSSYCELGTGRRREAVECGACNFTWRAASSVSAVKAYWRARKRRIRAQARVARARIPGVPSRPRVVPLPAPIPSSAPGTLPEKPLLALVASAAPTPRTP